MATQANMKVNEEAFVVYAIEAEDGSAAKLDGGLQAEVISGDVTTVIEGTEEAPEVVVIPGATVGAYQVRAFGDGDLGEGVRHIEDIISGEVTGLEAVRMVGTAGVRPKRTV